MKVHDLFVALSQCDRGATVSIKDGKLHVGGKALKVAGGKKNAKDTSNEEREAAAEETQPATDEKPEGDEQ